MTLQRGVEGDDVGDAEGLAGDDQEVAGLHRDVGDCRIADDDLGGRPRQAQELGLVVFDDQVLGLCGPCGQGKMGRAASPQRLGPGLRAPGRTNVEVMYASSLSPWWSACSSFSVQIVKEVQTRVAISARSQRCRVGAAGTEACTNAGTIAGVGVRLPGLRFVGFTANPQEVKNWRSCSRSTEASFCRKQDQVKRG